MKKSVALSIVGLIFLMGGFVSFLMGLLGAATILTIVGILIYLYKKFKKEII
jgi:hypothetical protein